MNPIARSNYIKIQNKPQQAPTETPAAAEEPKARTVVEQGTPTTTYAAVAEPAVRQRTDDWRLKMVIEELGETPEVSASPTPEISEIIEIEDYDSPL